MRATTLFVPVAFLVSYLGSPPTVTAQNTAPSVSNVQASQRAGTGWVDIYYDVDDLDGDMMTVRVICSTDGGATFDLLVKSAMGDGLDGSIPSGTSYHIEWNAAQDYPGRYWENVVAKVLATDGAAMGGGMVLVAAGDFTMGYDGSTSSSVKPEHVVYLDAYYIDKYEVTNAEYQIFMDAGGYSTEAYWSEEGWAWRVQNNITAPYSWGYSSCSSSGFPGNSGEGFPGFPVAGVSWYEAEAYANFANKRLPTEAEWEKAARGPSGWVYPWGGTSLDSYRVNMWESEDPFEPCTSPVGFFDGRLYPGTPAFQTIDTPGPYGTYDQSGNVMEWVADWYDPNYYVQSPFQNPPGPLSGSSKVLRGGSSSQACWEVAPGQEGLTAYSRFGRGPGSQFYAYVNPGRFEFYGFRCAKDAP